MRLDKMTATACMVGILLGLLAAVSFASTPYPDEAGGSACYNVGVTGGNDCDEIANSACEEGVGDCYYCTGANEFEETFCGASTAATTCETSGSTLNCGDQYEGVCDEDIFGGWGCDQGTILVADNGCSSMDIECTGTN